ncbi:MAG: penicillin-binding transpeptidase domain-containing protein [Polyangiaceae bacterium]
MRRRGLTLIAAVALASPAAGGETERAVPDVSRATLHGGTYVAPTADGSDVALTLDPQLQRAAGQLIAQANPAAAAVIVVHAPTGRVLALVERTPKGGSYGDLLLRPGAPSASVFKIVTTAALLQRGHVSPKQKVCTAGGERRIERRHLEAPKTRDSQCGLFFSALGHSRNAVYAQLVTSSLMRADLEGTIDDFGANGAALFDLPARNGSIRLPYNDLAFARTAAGFENVKLSAIGAAQLAAVVMSGGKRMAFHVLRDTADAAEPQQVLTPATAQVMRRMMEVTVHAGTSLEAFSAPNGQSYLGPVRVAGKTGTLRPDSNTETSSWFVGFAPSRQPEVLVSVVLQNGKVWRRKANELARDVLRVWFARRGVRGVTDPLGDAQR